MSKATKRKHVINESQSDQFDLPKIDQKVVQILESRGNNLHLVRDANQEVFLVSMPSKYRRNIWVKRGDLVLVESIREGDKVKGEIVRIYNKQALKYLIKEGYWISDENTSDNSQEFDIREEEFTNPNRPPAFDDSSTDSDDD